jgi:hypothetical protein
MMGGGYQLIFGVNGALMGFGEVLTMKNGGLNRLCMKNMANQN